MSLRSNLKQILSSIGDYRIESVSMQITGTFENIVIVKIENSEEEYIFRLKDVLDLKVSSYFVVNPMIFSSIYLLLDEEKIIVDFLPHTDFEFDDEEYPYKEEDFQLSNLAFML